MYVLISINWNLQNPKSSKVKIIKNPLYRVSWKCLKMYGSYVDGGVKHDNFLVNFSKIDLEFNFSFFKLSKGLTLQNLKMKN